MWCDVWRVMFLSPLLNLDILLISKLIIDRYSSLHLHLYPYHDLIKWMVLLTKRRLTFLTLRLACCLYSITRQKTWCEIAEKRSSEDDIKIVDSRKSQIVNCSSINQLQVMRINTVNIIDRLYRLYRSRINCPFPI